MRIRLLKTYAGAQGQGRAGDEQDVEEAFARQLIEADAAELVEAEVTPPAGLPVVETAAFVTAASGAGKPERKGRAKKMETR